MILPVSPLAKMARTKRRRRAPDAPPPAPLPPVPALDSTMVFDTVSFTLLGPPVPKRRARKGKGDRWYTPGETAAFERSIASAMMFELAKRRRAGGGAWPLRAYYELTVYAFFPDHLPRDIDNVVKAVSDGLNTIAWDDDRQVLDIVGRLRFDAKNPRTEVTVEVIAC